jgi:hypothetical protein
MWSIFTTLLNRYNMKKVYTFLFTAAMFAIGFTSLEAGHHHRKRVSLELGTVVPARHSTYVVEQYPSYVEEHVYMDPYMYGHPYRQTVHVYHPAPARVYHHYQRPAIFSGISFGFSFR